MQPVDDSMTITNNDVYALYVHPHASPQTLGRGTSHKTVNSVLKDQNSSDPKQGLSQQLWLTYILRLKHQKIRNTNRPDSGLYLGQQIEESTRRQNVRPRLEPFEFERQSQTSTRRYVTNVSELELTRFYVCEVCRAFLCLPEPGNNRQVTQNVLNMI
eukprot:jgi/Botrbrau1/22/Bobra.0022s0018.1